MTIVKIPVAQLSPGMYIVNPGISWMKAPLLYMREGYVTSEEEIAHILKQGYSEVCHDPDRFKRPASPAVESDPDAILLNAAPALRPPRVALDEELGQARQVYANSFEHVKKFMQSAREGLVDMSASQPYVESIISSLDRNLDALISLSKLKSSDEYTYTHCVNVTIFAVAYAHYLGLPEDKLHLVGMAGLFHDYGKSMIPSEILNAPRRLEAKEQEIMRAHVLLGYDKLKTIGGIAPEILQGVVQHHERHNGSGYPYQLAGRSIGLYGRILSVSDNYDALSARRVYKEPMPPNKALAIMYKMSGQAWAPGCVEKFIKMLGIYPVGTAVELESGERGVVCGSNPNFPAQPRIMIAFDARGKAAAPPYSLDLTRQPGLNIARSLTSDEARLLDVEALLGVPCDA